MSQRSPPDSSADAPADSAAGALGRNDHDDALADVTFEQALAELETLVEAMEGGELSLEQALSSFERGMKLQSFCQASLEKAEQKVRILTGEDDGDLTPFATES